MMILLYLLLTVGGCWCQDDRILYPIHEEGLDVGLTVLPGAGLTYDQYREIATFVQGASPYRLWVHLADTPLFPGCCNSIQTSHNVLIEAGMASDAPFFASGHSMGAGTIITEVEADASLVTGLITWGGILIDDSLDSFPAPVMTINGDLDGFSTARITSATKQYRAMSEMDPTVIYKFPMVTVIGTNHGQYATGDMPSNVIALDLPADKDGPVARKEVADYTSTFISYLVKKSLGEDTSNEESVMDEAYETQTEICKPIIEMFDKEANEADTESPWVAEAQRLMLRSTEDVDMKNTIVTRRQLRNLQPYRDDNPDGSAYIQTYAAMNKEFLSIRQAYDTVDAKMLAGLEETSCAEINSISWNRGYGASSDLAKQRFDKRQIEVLFEDDDVKSSETSWSSEDLKFDFDGKTLLVRSPSYVADDFHHCKLLSPAKVLEWIYVDGLRP